MPIYTDYARRIWQGNYPSEEDVMRTAERDRMVRAHQAAMDHDANVYRHQALAIALQQREADSCQ